MMTGESEREAGGQDQPHGPKLSGVILDEEHLLTLTEISQACSVQTGYIIELVDEGLLTPESGPEISPGEAPHFWRFTGAQMRRARRASRLQVDLGINLAGVALALQLLDEIEALRERLEALDRANRTWED
ncbi:chaperone modulator CbpM [Nitrosovibrio tenuis]|uniref:Transcriptional regulator, MerR family n=1 Tax=Nitrosovibrio tenuis TaxID=1233 RepID=A0A1H7IK90_9PROT|nr:chaperone modulator CbpM [Nitrosovibrio tenuis]SEK62147.1 transcriptional regulator, MerR family [Nitrosovibrio tenuis]